MAAMIGETIGGYRVLRSIGKGGMGEVYVAEHALLGRRAAVKVLLPAFCTNQEYVERFFNEARAAAAIKHSGIVEIYDFGHREDGSAFIVMEFLEGQSLAQRIATPSANLPRASAAETIIIGRQIASVLVAAHDIGIIHRDLKPDNVFLVPDPDMPGGERVKLLDFGIAKLGEEYSSGVKTRTGTMMGTPAYMSPEQCRGAGGVTHSSDLYSLGCILFEMLSGRPPYRGAGGGEIIAQHIYEPPPQLGDVGVAVPNALRVLVGDLLAKEPSQRPADAASVKNKLGAIIGLDDRGRRSLTSPITRADQGPRLKTTLSSAASSRPFDSIAADSANQRGSRWKTPVVVVSLVAAAGLGLGLVVNGFGETPSEAGNIDEPRAERGASAAIDESGGDHGQVAVDPSPAVEEKVTADAPTTPVEEVRMRIESQPSGATVVRDSAVLGETPILITVGPHELPLAIELQKAGYHPVQRTITSAISDTYQLELLPMQADAESDESEESEAAKRRGRRAQRAAREAKTAERRRAARSSESKSAKPTANTTAPSTPTSVPARSPGDRGRLNPFDKSKKAKRPKLDPFEKDRR